MSHPNTREPESVSIKPVFVELLPELDSIKPGELWISHKYRTMNLRCPCGCGNLTVLSLHPSRWHVCFNGKTVSLRGPTGGSVWANSGCGSHYFIRDNKVIWADSINPDRHEEYEQIELNRLVESQQADLPTRRPWITRIFHRLAKLKNSQ